MAASKNTIWPSKTELLKRTRRLQKLMAQAGMDGALFFQNADLIYLCGTTQAEAVFVPGRGTPLVLARAIVDRVRAETNLPDVEPMPSWNELRPRLEAHARRLKTFGLELDVLPVTFFRRIRQAALDGLDLVDVSPLIRRARSIKSAFEIKQMQGAARLIDQVYRTIPSVLAEGVTEVGLEGRLTGLARSLGHQGITRIHAFNQELYFGHTLSGANSLVRAKSNSPTGGWGVGPGLGQGAGTKTIGPNELVSVDIGGAYGGYIVDLTRLFFTGPIPDQVERAYARLLELMKKIIDFIRPGRTGRDVYRRAFALAEENGLAQGFMGLGEKRCPFVGHGVGIEIDEWPILSARDQTRLAAGMTLAIEPRVFLPEFGVVGFEDTFVLTEDGPQPITFSDRRIIEVSIAS